MKTVKLSLLGYRIDVQICEHIGAQKGFVETERFRPNDLKQSLNNGILKATSITMESEFISDILFQLNKINEKGELSPDSITYALKSACSNHIAQCGRLIITDPYTYLDCTLHIIGAATKMPISDLEGLYSGYLSVMVDTYKEDIYIQQMNSLVKLSKVL